MICEACGETVGKARTREEIFTLFEDHLRACPAGGVVGKDRKKKANTPLWFTVGFVLGIAALAAFALLMPEMPNKQTKEQERPKP